MTKQALDHYMSQEQLDDFKTRLLAWRAELMEQQELALAEQRGRENHADPNDAASDVESAMLSLRVADRNSKLIRRINKTLKLIDAGDYGYCDMCGCEIGTDRLNARMLATECFDCKTINEEKERHRAA